MSLILGYFCIPSTHIMSHICFYGNLHFFSINLSIFQQFFLEVTKQQPIHVNLSVCLTTNSPKHVVKLKKMASYHLMKCSSSYLVQIFEQKDVFAGFLQSMSLLICFGVSDLKCTAKHCGILGSRCHRNAQKRKISHFNSLF